MPRVSRHLDQGPVHDTTRVTRDQIRLSATCEIQIWITSHRTSTHDNPCWPSAVEILRLSELRLSERLSLISMHGLNLNVEPPCTPTPITSWHGNVFQRSLEQTYTVSTTGSTFARACELIKMTRPKGCVKPITDSNLTEIRIFYRNHIDFLFPPHTPSSQKAK